MNPDDLKTIESTIVGLTPHQQDAIRKIMGMAANEIDNPKKLNAAQLRKKYPALKDAYDQYRVVLKLVQGQEIV